MSKKVRKLSDKQFLAILRANGGLSSRTARAITDKYGFSYTRQSVEARKKKFPDEVFDIEEENLDVAEETIINIMRSTDRKTALRAADLYLKAKGKGRGYGEALDITSGNKPIEPFSGVLPVYKPNKGEDSGQ